MCLSRTHRVPYTVGHSPRRACRGGILQDLVISLPLITMTGAANAHSMCRNQLLHRAACDRFSVADVTAPDEIPLLSHLSSINNSYLFEREHAQEYLDPLMAEDDGFRAVVEDRKSVV